MQHFGIDIERQAEVFGALADNTRLKLVKLLCQQQVQCALCVNALASRLGVTQSAVSQHLRVLKSIGLVKAQRRGTHVHYFIDREVVQSIQDLMVSVLAIDKSAELEQCVDCSKIKIPGAIPIKRGMKIDIKQG
jgi:ArsR family transcriptional regulator, arsenate/arsenite/antimonite-responsive transcriptional repressor